MFDAGELRLVILALMEGQPRHGYDLIREIETRSGSSYAPSPGIVYPTLTLLEELGQVETVVSEGTKRLFSATAAGLAHLQENRAAADAALARLDALRAESGSYEAGPVWRAMQNLRAVLGQRLDGALDKDQQLAVADLIDEASRKIERL